MENIISESLIKMLSISIVFSVFEMALIQKIKTIFHLKKTYQVILINFISTFTFGPLFLIWFFNLNIINSLWVSFFSFIGAPALYESLRKQNIINYNPKSLKDINNESNIENDSKTNDKIDVNTNNKNKWLNRHKYQQQKQIINFK